MGRSITVILSRLSMLGWSGLFFGIGTMLSGLGVRNGRPFGKILWKTVVRRCKIMSWLPWTDSLLTVVLLTLNRSAACNGTRATLVAGGCSCTWAVVLGSSSSRVQLPACFSTRTSSRRSTCGSPWVPLVRLGTVPPAAGERSWGGSNVGTGTRLVSSCPVRSGCPGTILAGGGSGC